MDNEESKFEEELDEPSSTYVLNEKQLTIKSKKSSHEDEVRTPKHTHNDSENADLLGSSKSRGKSISTRKVAHMPGGKH